jgi:hypothetical protein
MGANLSLRKYTEDVSEQGAEKNILTQGTVRGWIWVHNEELHN